MINYKDKLTRIEKNEIKGIFTDLIDYYSDFYITKNNMRIFLKENLSELFNAVNKDADVIAYGNGSIVLTYGLGSKYRTYLKLIGENTGDLIKTILWNVNCDLYVKIKKTNPNVLVLNQYNFEVIGYRGKELLLKRSK